MTIPPPNIRLRYGLEIGPIPSTPGLELFELFGTLFHEAVPIMLTHLDPQNRPQMVDIGGKAVTRRTAHAIAVVELPPPLAGLLEDGDIMTKKGPVFQTAILAGVMGAKRTSELIPLCHPLALTKAEVAVSPGEGGLQVTARVRTTGPTGVEMEALTAVSVACLTLYDMLKSVDRGMVIEAVRLMEKSGGASGDWRAT